MTTLVATEPIIRARLKKARTKRYRGGVLGLRAKPVWDGDGFDYDGTPVTVVPCPSVLAIWEAIESRDDSQWTVVLTSIEDDELGDTVLAHLVDGRLITPDPWDALRGNFSASTIEPALYRSSNDRSLANGLLGLLSSRGYTPAPAGVLTQDHAMSAVARDVLQIVKSPDVEVDGSAVLEWSRSHHAVDGLVRLQTEGGPELTEAFRHWLAGRSGRLAKPLSALLERNRIAELMPLGVVAGLFADDKADPRALGLFLGRYGLTGLDPTDLAAWYNDASSSVMTTLSPEQRQIVLQTASGIVDELGIAETAASSSLLPHGLQARLIALAEAVIDAVPRPLPDNLTPPLLARTALQHIQKRWTAVETHFLAPASPTVRSFDGGLRLARWLAEPLTALSGLAASMDEYVSTTSWVDTALVTARRGAQESIPAEALRALIDTAVLRRAGLDRAFASALADAPTPTVTVVENVLPDLVIPLAKTTPTLLLVVDALSLAATNDLVAAAQRDGWSEVSAASDSRRTAALAVLPTLTQRSRCSLLCGELREGADTAERSGFVSLIRNAQLQPPGNIPDPIFHKRDLDAKPSGQSLATGVSNAIADTTNQPLVAAVLNYVDDTLHHTDPGGTDWNLDTITHLRALLHAAKNAGRTVVITADHGHLIEYGTSTKADRSNIYGQRAHGDFTQVDPDLEVVVEGPRVLTDNNRVVLAVDENIRYGARNAGYHGGASPAEAIVPVVVLTAGRLAETMVPVVGAEPSWWHPGILRDEPEVPTDTPQIKKRTQQGPTLFDDEPDTETNTLPDKVVSSAMFTAQIGLAGRIVLRSDQIRNLLVALLSTSANEITLAQAAVALGVATPSVNGALMQTKRVLDVEGYEVLRVQGGVVRLDVALLTEQFGVTP
jgi:hypothetical protein